MEDRPLNISITFGTVIKTVLVLVAVWLLYYLRDFVLLVVTAIVIASAIEPAVAVLKRRKLPRLLSVITIYLSLFAVFAGIFYFFLPSVLAGLATFMSSLPAYLDAFNSAGAFDEYSRIFGTSVPGALSTNDIIENMRGILNASGMFSGAFETASNIFGGVFSLVLIIVFSFYFAVLETGVDDFLRVVTPVKYHAYVLSLWRRSQHKIGLWMQGQMILAVIMGVLVYLGLMILGVKHALLLAIIAAVFEIIPVFGPIFAAVPAVIIGFIDGGATLGLLTIALYVIVQQFENHLIYPLVVTRVVGVPALLVILALIVGAKLAGFLGVLLSVPAAGAIQELVKDIESRHIFADTSKN
ncbi:MAG: AI-2E family transporter [bacterium]|nr:AI-2E family transporter [bacterium]